MYLLEWENHCNYLSRAIKILLKQNVLSDCTISVEGQNVSGHKLVLAACSPYFESLFTLKCDQNPIILKDVKFNDLKTIIDFIYKGEVIVPSEQLDSFLSTARLLQVRGLANFFKEENKDEDDNNPSANMQFNMFKMPQVFTGSELQTSHDKDVRTGTMCDTAGKECNLDNDKDERDISGRSLEIKTENTCLAVSIPLNFQQKNVIVSDYEGRAKEDSNDQNLETVNDCDVYLRHGIKQESEVENHSVQLLGSRERWKQSFEEGGGRNECEIKEELHSSESEDTSMQSLTVSSIKEEQFFDDERVDVGILDLNLGNNFADERLQCYHGENEASHGKFSSEGPKEKVSSTINSLETSNLSISVDTCDSYIQRKNEDMNTEGSFNCHHCGESFLRKNLIIRHLKNHSEKKSFKCEKCDKQFSHKSDFKRHNLIHSGEKPHECKICGKRFLRNENISRHLKIHTEDKSFTCEYCGKQFYCSDKLSVHLRVHTGEKPHKCKQCGKSFQQKSYLTIHMRTHEAENTLVCQHCGKQFLGRSSLNKHMSNHPETKFHCKKCGQYFSCQERLDKHLEVHVRERSVLCKCCGKVITKRYLMKHMRIHSIGRRIECQYCGSKFPDNSKLDIHLRVHTGETPYECHLCKKRFSYRTSLITHLQKHTGDEPF